MAKILARRLTYWLMGTPDDSPPPVPIPPEITPLRDHVAFFLNLRGRLPPEMTREEIMDSLNNTVSDRELQAHVMAYLRDYHGMTFDPKLNPNAPTPQYYSSAGRSPQPAGTVITDKIAKAESPRPYVPKPYFTSVPVGFDAPTETPASPEGKVTAAPAPAAETVKAEGKKEAPAAAAVSAQEAEKTTAEEKSAPKKTDEKPARS